MNFIKNILSSKFFSPRLDGGLKSGIVGISATTKNVALAYVQGTSAQDAQVIAYQCVEITDQQEQADVIKNFVEEHQLINCLCNYVLPVEQYVLGIIESPKGDTKDSSHDAILNAVKDFVDYPIEEAVIDLFPLPFKRIDDQQDVSYAVVAHNSIINNISPLINSTGLNLKYIDIHELCLRNIAMLHPEQDQGTLLLKLFANGGNIIFIQNNSIVMSRRIDLPLQNLMAGNVESQEWQLQSAEQKANIFLDTLTLDLQRSMDYSSSLFHHPPLQRIVITPTELNPTNIESVLTKNLGMSAFVLNLPNLVKFKQEISIQEQEQCLLAIGAGLRYLQEIPHETTD